MKHQLQTIRAGLETATCYTMLGVDAHSVQTALTALTQLEATAGEPVYWQWRRKGHDWTLEYTFANEVQVTTEDSERRALYATPPAQQQQYEAGDMASAHNDGFRAGVASVAQQPLITVEDSLRFRLDCTKERLEAAEKECSELRAKLKAQQPQAMPRMGKKLHDDLLAAIRSLIDAQNEPERWGCVGPDASDIAWGKVTQLVNYICVALDSPPTPQQAEAAPPGFALVPVEPSDAFVRRAKNHGVWTEQEVRNLYDDIIAAAPTVSRPQSMPSDQQIEQWADDFITSTAYNRSVAIQIATKAAQWVREQIAAPQQAEAVHRYVLELPDDDKREAKVCWFERKEGAGEITHHLCISVEEPNQSAYAPQEYAGVRCMCVLTGCRAGPGCPHYTDHCKAHIAHVASAPQQANAVPSALQKAEARLLNLIGEYWALAYAEGEEGRNHDTEDGAAQRTHAAIAKAVNDLIDAAMAQGEKP